MLKLRSHSSLPFLNSFLNKLPYINFSITFYNILWHFTTVVGKQVPSVKIKQENFSLGSASFLKVFLTTGIYKLALN